ncbi:MAG: hypothetical protein K2O18_15460 [Oscillospiraceae bacterium]|nr:hypothetical protein [Oscillospiraceae bacterium]
MKTRDLWTGVGFVAAGILFLLAALLLNTPLGSLFCGLCGAFTVPGLAQIYRYVKWTSPRNAPIYRERLEQEQIDLRDERKSMLRDRSGRYAYVLGMLILCAAMVAFYILGAFGVIGAAEARLMILFLAGY